MRGRQSLQPVEELGPRTHRSERRSPWHGLTGSEALELQDAESTPARLAMSEVDSATDVVHEYAERTVLALTGNDLRLALRCATIAAAAMNTRDRAVLRLEGSSQVEGET